MYTFITVLIIIACALLVLVVLIQNPKGGGLGQTFGGLSNQFLGVKRTTDFLEKATWTLAIVLVGLSLMTFFFTGSGGSQNRQGSALENSEVPATEETSPLGSDSSGFGQ